MYKGEDNRHKSMNPESFDSRIKQAMWTPPFTQYKAGWGDNESPENSIRLHHRPYSHITISVLTKIICKGFVHSTL